MSGVATHPIAKGIADLDVIVEFPDAVSAEALLASDAYKEIEAVRKEHTTGPFMIVEGL